jgi:hypothetical protein
MCPKEYKKKISLINHKNRNECDKYNNLKFKCTDCNKRYLLKKTLLKHMKEKHSTNKKCKEVKCPLCNKSFICQGNVNRHLKKGQCSLIGNKSSVTINNNDNSVNIQNNNNIQNNMNITINFGMEKLDDWIEDVGRKMVDRCLRDLNGLPTNLLEAKHVLSKRNMNVYLPSEEDKYKNSLVYSNGWKEMKTSQVLDKMLIGVANDIYDMITNDSKYKLRLSKKLKEALDKKITLIQNDKYLQGPTANMLLKNKEVLSEHYNKTNIV